MITTMAPRMVDEAVGDSPSKRIQHKRSQREMDGSDKEEDDLSRTPSKRQRRAPNRLPKSAITDDPYEVPDDYAAEEIAVAEVQPREEEEEEEKAEEKPTPTPKRKRGRPPKNTTPVAASTTTTTPSKTRQVDKFETPTRKADENGITPRRKAAVDRSAKRKSARALIERVVGDEVSEEEDDEGLAQEIYESSEEEEGGEEGPKTPTSKTKRTPSKRGRKPKARSPTPPRDLPAHEMYFEHNKPGRAKTSNNTLADLDLLTHEEYFSVLKDYEDPHAEDVAYLQSLHETSFSQWSFELTQGFSLCLFGLGSKRPLLTRFAEHTHARIRSHGRHKIVMVNGYVRNLTLRDILLTVASAVDPDAKLPAQPAAMLSGLLSLLSEKKNADRTVSLILNSIDAPGLRKHATQQSLSLLAGHPNVQLACSVDTADFPLLWDAALRASFNFVFHDTTTFATPTAELDPVDDVHELLGRQVRAVNGKEGVVFVLRSLPENAKNLFRLLVTEVLLAIDEEGEQGGASGGENPGVEYRMMYNKAVEEFVCSSEMAFRTLLKEFHDHQMITSRKDAIGTELLSVPFRREELEGILEELMT